MNGYYIEETVKFKNLKSYIIFFPNGTTIGNFLHPAKELFFALLEGFHRKSPQTHKTKYHYHKRIFNRGQNFIDVI